jgi:hypothetical protein
MSAFGGGPDTPFKRADFRLWHKTDMPTALRDVRFQGQSGKHVLIASFSGFDPTETRGLTSF